MTHEYQDDGLGLTGRRPDRYTVPPEGASREIRLLLRLSDWWAQYPPGEPVGDPDVEAAIREVREALWLAGWPGGVKPENAR